MPKLVDIDIQEVSGVDKAANKRQFLIIKQEKGENLDKADKKYKTENGIEFPKEAYLYVPDPEKSSTWKLRTWANLEEKETPAQVGAAIAALSSGGFRGNKVDLPADEVPKIKAKLRALWQKVNPDKDSKEMPEHIKKDEGMKDKLWSFVKGMFLDTKVTEAKDFSQLWNERKKREDLWDMSYTLQDAINNILADESIENKKEAIETSVKQFVDKLSSEGLIKAGAKISAERLGRLKAAHQTLSEIIAEAEENITKGDGNDMTKEEITKMVEETLKPVVEKLKKLGKPEDGKKDDKKNDILTKEEIQITINEAVKKALEPVEQRLEVVEKVKGIKKSIDGQDNSGNVKKSLWAGVL